MRDNFWKRLAAIVLCAAMMMSTAADVVEATGLIPSSETGAGGYCLDTDRGHAGSQQA